MPTVEARDAEARPAPASAWDGAVRVARGVFAFCGDALVSPAVILADLWYRERTLNRRWLAAYLTLVAVVSTIGWAYVFAYRVQVDSAWSVVRSYGDARGELGGVPYADTIRLYAVEHDLDPALVAAIIKVESSFRAEAVSRAGARGLMQIRPATWRELRPDSPCLGGHQPPACGDDCIFTPATNIRAGCLYLRRMLNDFGGNFIAAFAAYNAGASAVRAVSPAELPIPPFPETENYVRQVLSIWTDLRARTEGSSPSWALDQPGQVNFVPAAIGGALWLLLIVWLALKGARGRGWETQI
ncbi:MAG: lytic transglycosylase domain-containing protein [Bacillota bacterium]|nr:lytic transglycosylase domain-containing protein [Bacillota bacterium]